MLIWHNWNLLKIIPLGFLHNPKYNVYPVIEFIEKHISKLCEEGVVWAGYFMCLEKDGLDNWNSRENVVKYKHTIVPLDGIIK